MIGLGSDKNMKSVLIQQASSSKTKTKRKRQKQLASITCIWHFCGMDLSGQQSDLGLQDFIDQVDAAFRDENMVS